MKNDTQSLIVFVGVPACGKSTYLKKLLPSLPPKTFVFSTDDEVEKLCAADGVTYTQGFQKHIRQATKNANAALETALGEHRPIVWDQTNLTVGKRKSIISRVANSGMKYSQYLVDFMPTTEVGWQILRERQVSRPDKVISRKILDNMANSYEEPSMDEGWQAITKVPLGVRIA